MDSGISHDCYLDDCWAQQRLQLVRAKLTNSLSQQTKDSLMLSENIEEMLKLKEDISEFDRALLESIQTLLFAEERIDLLQESVQAFMFPSTGS